MCAFCKLLAFLTPEMQEFVIKEILFVTIFFLLPAFIFSAFGYLKLEDIFDHLQKLDQKEMLALKKQAITHSFRIFLLGLVWCIIILDHIPGRYIAIPVIIGGMFQINEGILMHFSRICFITFGGRGRRRQSTYLPIPFTPKKDLPDSDYKITIVPNENSTYTIQIFKYPYTKGFIFWKIVMGIFLSFLGFGIFMFF